MVHQDSLRMICLKDVSDDNAWEEGFSYWRESLKELRGDINHTLLLHWLMKAYYCMSFPFSINNGSLYHLFIPIHFMIRKERTAGRAYSASCIEAAGAFDASATYVGAKILVLQVRTILKKEGNHSHRGNVVPTRLPKIWAPICWDEASKASVAVNASLRVVAVRLFSPSLLSKV